MSKPIISVRASATITRGATTNRVAVRRGKSAGELVALDAACERTQMARSHFIRQAVKHFIERVRAK